MGVQELCHGKRVRLTLGVTGAATAMNRKQFRGEESAALFAQIFEGYGEAPVKKCLQLRPFAPGLWEGCSGCGIGSAAPGCRCGAVAALAWPC